MDGTLQIVVNLRSRSVEYSREEGADRFSCVLSGDMVTAEDIITDVPNTFDGESDIDKLTRIITTTHELAKHVGNLRFFSIIHHGNTVSIHPDDISFVTVKVTGDLRDLIPN